MTSKNERDMQSLKNKIKKQEEYMLKQDERIVILKKQNDHLNHILNKVWSKINQLKNECNNTFR